MFRAVNIGVTPTAVDLAAGLSIDQPTTVVITITSAAAGTNVLVGDSATTCCWPIQPFAANAIYENVAGYTTTGTESEQSSDMRTLRLRLMPGDSVYAQYPGGGTAQVVALFFSSSE